MPPRPLNSAVSLKIDCRFKSNFIDNRLLENMFPTFYQFSKDGSPEERKSQFRHGGKLSQLIEGYTWACSSTKVRVFIACSCHSMPQSHRAVVSKHLAPYPVRVSIHSICYYDSAEM